MFNYKYVIILLTISQYHNSLFLYSFRLTKHCCNQKLLQQNGINPRSQFQKVMYPSFPVSATPTHHNEQDPEILNYVNGTDISNSDTSTIQQQQKTSTVRKIQRIEKFARLPVWPAWNGVLIWIVGNIFGNDVAARLENTITGRVCPNFYNYYDTSPFVMLVHHCHTFASYDIFRYIQRSFFPEGFPAHPHRGFITITYILHGGFVHRDSEGIYQTYGSSDTAETKERYKGKHTQWLMTGRGMLHEEMFDLQESNQIHSRQELYQIWLNIPAKYKLDQPFSLLLGGENETPIVYSKNKQSKTLVLAGSYDGQSSIAPIMTDLVLFHVTLQPGSTWEYHLPASTFDTAFIYIRQGSLVCAGNSGDIADDNDTVHIPVHHTAFFERSHADRIKVTSSLNDVTDFMFLAGVPINEPCYASGSMVMNYPSEIEEAYSDYQKGLFGIPWDHKISNAMWQQHVQATRKIK